MWDYSSDDESLPGLSYSKSVVLPTWTMSKMFTMATDSNTRYINEKPDILKKIFKGQVREKCSIHTCLNWLIENRDFVTKFPQDVISDYTSKRLSGRCLTKSRPRQYVIDKLITLIKDKIKRKIKPLSAQKIKERDHFLLNLNFNSNKPCCNSFLKAHDSVTGFKMNNKYSQDEFFLKSFNQTLDSQPMDVSTTTEVLITNPNEFNDSCLCNKKDKSEDSARDGSPFKKVQTAPSSSNTAARGRLTKPRELSVPDGDNPLEYLQSSLENYSVKGAIPANYNVCYQFYIYIYPSLTDSNILLFQRHEMKKLSSTMTPFDFNKLVEDTKSDFLFDRRLRMVEKQCKCYIALEPLKNIFIKGLPHRLMKIHSTKYENIARALTVMEDTMPELMNNCVFTNEFPASIHSRKWSADNVFGRPLKRSKRTGSGGSSQWSQRIDPRKKFPNLNFVLDSRSNNVSTIKSDVKIIEPSKRKERVTKTEPTAKAESLPRLESKRSRLTSDNIIFRKILSRDTTNKSNAYDETSNINAHHCDNDTKASSMNILSNSSANNNSKYCLQKRIKCPASTFTNDKHSNDYVQNVLFEKFHCKLSKVDRNTCSDEQMKLTILYNSKEDFSDLCKSLGLCNKLKNTKINFD